VTRQYTGTLGKVAGCQVAVALQFATATQVVALNARLYLPEGWVADRTRMAQVGVPDGVEYRPKWEIALDMVRRAVAHEFRGVVLADSLFGTVTAFRKQLAADGRTYCIGIDSTPKVIAADADLGPVPPRSRTGRPPTRPAKVRRGATSPSVRQWAVDRATDFRPVTWREGSKGKMTGRFAARRVRPARRIAERIEWHYPPRHGSWLNVVECEFSVLSRQRLSRRVESIGELRRRVEAWENSRNDRLVEVDWRFTTADARVILHRLYPSTQ
jgi:SRSO17 transposase